jgi:hypothetical protein
MLNVLAVGLVSCLWLLTGVVGVAAGVRVTATAKTGPGGDMERSPAKGGQKWRKAEARLRFRDNMYAVAQMVRKPVRDVTFWGKAIHIYSSYKLMQLKNSLTRPLVGDQTAAERERMWDDLHDVNSKRMIDLCLSLRGFYLKTGQFLGTRHDFMPSQYTERLGKLHDDVPPMDGADARKIVEHE